MSVEDFTLTQLSGKTVYYVIWDLDNNTVWDQADNLFRALGSATSPTIVTVVEPVFSAGRFSTYNARVELEDVHDGPIKSFHVAAYFQAGAAPAPLTDRPAGYLNISIDRGTLRLTQDQVAVIIEDTTVGVGSERVDQDYGGPNNLCYTLDGIPVDNAEILVFLESNFLACNRGSEFVVAASRTKADGTWEKAIMLDPARYVIQFHKQGVSGPDAFTLVVSKDPAEISVTPLDVESCSPVIVPPPPVVPDPCETDGLDEFGGDGLILVDQDFGGVGELCYLLDGQPVANAEILLFDAAGYNAGNRQNKFAIVASRQQPDGTWEQPVKVNPGEYVIQFHKQNVAGPDAFPLTVA
jgi:hypothetical protein